MKPIYKKLAVALIGFALLTVAAKPIAIEAADGRGLFLERPTDKMMLAQIKTAFREQIDILENGVMHYPFPFTENADEWDRHSKFLLALHDSSAYSFAEDYKTPTKLSVLLYERMDSYFEPRIRVKIQRTFRYCDDWDYKKLFCNGSLVEKEAFVIVKDISFWNVNDQWEIKNVSNYKNWAIQMEASVLDWVCAKPGDDFDEMYRDCPVPNGNHGESHEVTKWG